MDPRQEAERAELLGSGERGLWWTDDKLGWHRLSIRATPREPGRPPVRAEDLLLPGGLGNLRMLASCAGMGAISTILYVWVPLMLLNFFVAVRGLVMVAALGGAFVALTVGLY